MSDVNQLQTSSTNLPPTSDTPTPTDQTTSPRFNWKQRLLAINKKQLTLLILSSVVLIFGGVMAWQYFERSNTTPNQVFNRLPDQVVFELKADKTQTGGIDPQTTFTLTSSKNFTVEEVESALHVVPNVDMAVKRKSPTEFVLTPQLPLVENTGYKFELTQVSADQTLPHVLGRFKFQTDGNFHLVSNTPRNKSTNVELNTAIELIFSHEEFEQIENNISIEPPVAGKWEKRFNSAFFLPDKLTPKTIYTIKINKNLGLKNSPKKLEEDKVIKFETGVESSNDNNYYMSLGLSSLWEEVSPQTAPILTSYSSENSGSQELEVVVYKFSNPDEFAKQWFKTQNQLDWTVYQGVNQPDLSNAPEFRRLNIPFVYDQASYRSFAIFPEPLPEGQYVLAVSRPSSDEKTYVWYQVTPLAAYTSIASVNTLVWVQSITDNKPVVAAQIEMGSGEKLNPTDENGLSLSNTPVSLIKKSDPESGYYLKSNHTVNTQLIKVRSGNQVLFIPTDPTANGYWGSYESYNKKVSLGDKYWKYINTDKPVYKIHDRLNFWGVLRPRTGTNIKDLKEVYATLTGFDGYKQTDYTPKTPVSIDKNGILRGTITIPAVSASTYSLNITDPQTSETLLSIYVPVESYTKPAYSIGLVSDKTAIVVGEKVKLSGTTQFYDNTPLVKLDLVHSVCDSKNTSAEEGPNITSDIAGRFNFEIKPELDKYNYDQDSGVHSFWPDNCSVVVKPKTGVEGDVSGSLNVKIFPNRYTVEKITNETDGGKKLTWRLFNLDLNKKISQLYADPTEYKGELARGVTINYKIYNQVIDKKENGTYYDPIAKTTQKRYQYSTRKVELNTGSGVTDDKGEVTIEVNPSKQETYLVYMTITDPEGRQAQDTTYIWGGGGWAEYDPDQSLSLNVIHDGQTATETQNYPYRFKLNETAKVYLERGDQALTESTQGRFLLRTAFLGTQKANISQGFSQNFTLSEDIAPNLNVKGVWFAGQRFEETWPVTFTLDTNPFKLNLSLSPAKKQYKPGDHAQVDLQVKTASGDNKSGIFTLAVIDKALLALRQYTNDILSSLYTTLPSGVMTSYSTHKLAKPGAEGGGGCFVAGTSITLSDGSTKPIEKIKSGDYVMSRSGLGQTNTVAQVISTYHTTGREYLVVNETMKVTPEHILLINGQWRIAETMRIGEFLLDEKGKFVPIFSIERRFDQVPIYNLTIDKTQTYFADGYLVHNQKGDRRVFKDVAFFGPIEVGNNGQGSTRFKLPDDLTTWAIFGEGLVPESLPQAGSGTSELVVSQPLAVHVTLASDYLPGDEPQLTIRAYGLELKENDPVSFSITAPSLDLTTAQNIEGKAYQPILFQLPKLKPGKHELIVTAKTKTFTDKLTRTILVKESDLSRTETRAMTLSPGQTLDWPEVKEVIETVFTDTGRSLALELLTKNQYSWHDRLDSRLARYLGYTWLESSQNKNVAPDFIGLYQYEDGLSLLQKSSQDPYYSWLVSLTAPELFDQNKLRQYFQSLLSKPDSTQTEKVQALGGLLVLGAPVQVQFDELKNQTKLDNTDLLYAGLSAHAVGNQVLAKHFFDQLQDEGIASDLGNLLSDSAKGEGARRAWLRAGLALAVRSDQTTKLVENAKRTHTDTTLTVLEETLVAKIGLEAQPIASSLDVEIRGEKKTLNFDGLTPRQTFMLQPEELKSVKINRVDGPVAVLLTTHTPISTHVSNPQLSIKKFINNADVANSSIRIKEGDVVKVSISFSSQLANNNQCLQITDYLPAGLMPIINYYANSYDFQSADVYYPYEIDGRKISFCSWNKNSGTISYPARVLSAGHYTTTPAIIQLVSNPGIFATSAPGSVTIEPLVP